MPNHGLERLSVRRYSQFFNSRNYQDHTACLFRGVPAAADNAEDRVSDLLGFLNGRHQVCADILLTISSARCGWNSALRILCRSRRAHRLAIFDREKLKLQDCGSNQRIGTLDCAPTVGFHSAPIELGVKNFGGVRA